MDGLDNESGSGFEENSSNSTIIDNAEVEAPRATYTHDKVESTSEISYSDLTE
jgi:hypothetical protein